MQSRDQHVDPRLDEIVYRQLAFQGAWQCLDVAADRVDDRGASCTTRSRRQRFIDQRLSSSQEQSPDYG